eukprot:TRINITY_DN3616_c0_g1_i2.p2 TRINITY_DN3616_c0_g1~~TRINITY_DN3616_c0_g1_i2.p2  ORF type:complete len:128 (+),score=28.83 TRINITY_DN3616_c0_g1_i2:194-577(+)
MDDEVLEKIGSPDAVTYVRTLPRQKGLPMSELVPTAPPEAQDLLRQMLSTDPSKRPTMRQVLRHPFFESIFDPEDEREYRGPPIDWRGHEKLVTRSSLQDAFWDLFRAARQEEPAWPGQTSSGMWGA